MAFKAEHKTKIDRLYIAANDGVRLKTPGGGGYGHADKRLKNAVQADEIDGYVEGL